MIQSQGGAAHMLALGWHNLGKRRRHAIPSRWPRLNTLWVAWPDSLTRFGGDDDLLAGGQRNICAWGGRDLLNEQDGSDNSTRADNDNSDRCRATHCGGFRRRGFPCGLGPDNLMGSDNDSFGAADGTLLAFGRRCWRWQRKQDLVNVGGACEPWATARYCAGGRAMTP